MRQMGMQHKAVNAVGGEQTTGRLWVSGYEDLDKYLADCSDEDNVWDLAERITDDAQASGCELAVQDVFEELVLRRSNLIWKATEEFCRKCFFIKIYNTNETACF